MASKRRSIHTTSGGVGSGLTSGSASPNLRSSGMNFRPNFTQEDRGGTRPTPAPSSIGLILITMFLHVCKKSLLFDTRLKVAIYCGAIFIVSLIADFVTMPRSYFSRSDNALNQYFVKWGWGWLLIVTVPWVALTAHTVGCGRRSILIKHLCRLALATVAWLFWIKVFNYVENNFGRCLDTKDPTLQLSKAKCLQAGKFWNGLDISGHAFILIYSTLILAEEGAALIGWEGITDLIMKEEHSRSNSNEVSSGPLKGLSNEDLEFLKKAHKTLTPYLRGLFVIMTFQQILWDLMLLSTMIYYHIMIEKFLGGVAAISTWYITYHWWYRLPSNGSLAPGEGLFKYNECKVQEPPSAIRTRRTTANGNNKFMGLPIRSQNNGAKTNPQKTGDSDSISARS